MSKQHGIQMVQNQPTGGAYLRWVITKVAHPKSYQGPTTFTIHTVFSSRYLQASKKAAVQNKWDARLDQQWRLIPDLGQYLIMNVTNHLFLDAPSIANRAGGTIFISGQNFTSNSTVSIGLTDFWVTLIPCPSGGPRSVLVAHQV
jgi:hypothetical protein